MGKHKAAVRLEGSDPAQIIMPCVRPVSLGERLNWQAQLPMQPRRAAPSWRCFTLVDRQGRCIWIRQISMHSNQAT